jgi:hypothetical protein
LLNHHTFIDLARLLNRDTVVGGWRRKWTPATPPHPHFADLTPPGMTEWRFEVDKSASNLHFVILDARGPSRARRRRPGDVAETPA